MQALVLLRQKQNTSENVACSLGCAFLHFAVPTVFRFYRFVKQPIQMPVKICMQRTKSTFPKLKPSEELQKGARAKGTKTTPHTHKHTHKVSKGETKEKKKRESGNLSEQYRDTNAQTAVYFGQLNVK